MKEHGTVKTSFLTSSTASVFIKVEFSEQNIGWYFAEYAGGKEKYCIKIGSYQCYINDAHIIWEFSRTN